MRIVSDEFDAEVAGSTAGDRLEVHAWRGGQLVAADLNVASWSLSWDATRQVQGYADLVIADPDGRLLPWSLTDRLSPGGSRLQITWVSGTSGTRVPLGWWRIRTADPDEAIRVYGAGATAVIVPGGGTVTLHAQEETATAVLDRLDSEGSPAAGATCLGEVRRLLGDLMPVVVDAAVVDATAPASLVYGLGRMDGVEDLLDVVAAQHRMGGDGSFEVIPTAPTAPVWTVRGGDDGVLVRLSRRLSDDGVYNAVISTGQTDSGLPLVGRAYLPAGPLAWGVDTPFGRVPAFHNAVATTQAGVNADAATTLANQVATAYVDLDVIHLAHPGLQPWDTVELVAATPAGRLPLIGQVVATTMVSARTDRGATPAKSQTSRVRVSVEALAAVAELVSRA